MRGCGASRSPKKREGKAGSSGVPIKAIGTPRNEIAKAWTEKPQNIAKAAPIKNVGASDTLRYKGRCRSLGRLMRSGDGLGMTVLGDGDAARLTRQRQREGIFEWQSGVEPPQSKKTRGKSRSLTDIRDKGSRGCWVRDDMLGDGVY